MPDFEMRFNLPGPTSTQDQTTTFYWPLSGRGSFNTTQIGDQGLTSSAAADRYVAGYAPDVLRHAVTVVGPVEVEER